MQSANIGILRASEICSTVHSEQFTFKTIQHTNNNCRRKTLNQYGQLNTNERNVAYMQLIRDRNIGAFHFHYLQTSSW